MTKDDRSAFGHLISFLVGIGAPVAFTVLSMGAQLYILKIELASSALVWSGLALLTTMVVGALSMHIERGARFLRVTPRVFLSYSHDESERATRLASALRDAGAIVWFDEEQLRTGEEFSSVIKKAIQEANSVVVLLSREPGPNLSYELRIAQANDIPIIAAVPPNLHWSTNLQSIKYFNVDGDEADSFSKIAQAAVDPNRLISSINATTAHMR